MERRHLKQHRENDCVNRAVACTYCDGEVRQSNMKDHLEICLKFPISCILSCGKEDIPRGMMEEHVTTHCPKQNICVLSVVMAVNLREMQNTLLSIPNPVLSPIWI